MANVTVPDLQSTPWRKIALGICALGVAAYPYFRDAAAPSPGRSAFRTSDESSTVTVRRSSEDILVRLGDATSRKITSTEVTSKRATFTKE